MNNQLHIRNAVEGDLPAILEVYNDAIVNTTAVYQENNAYFIHAAYLV